MTSTNITKSIKRKKAADKVIHRRMLYTAGLGLIPIPLVDTVTILGTQVLMVKDIATIYNIPFKQHRVKSFIGSLIGSVGTINVIKAIPGIGSLLGGVAVSLGSAAATYAIGKVFTQHFDQGGTLLDFNPVESSKYFQELYEEGQQKATNLQASKASELKKTAAKIFGTTASNNATTIETSSTKEATSSSQIAKEARRAQALRKAKRRKILKAKRRKERRNKWLRRIAFLLIIGGLSWQFYIKDKLKNTSQSTEIDLFMQEATAKRVDLQPAQSLDSLTTVTIDRFASNSTEGVMAKYIQDSVSTYPKRYALSAVRFVGSSSELSTGAQKQLANIAFLMKKYPALQVNLYGHTTNIGPTFNRKRIGRDRARVLRDVFVDMGIPGYRITGNYIEKSSGVHDEYWGAEIVIDVSTEENVVEVKTPLMPASPSSIIPKIFKKTKKEAIKPTLEEEDKEDTEAFVKFKLPSGKEINIFEGGPELQIVAFIEDTSKVIDKTTWFNLNRVLFAKASIKLDIEKSEGQLNNLVEILNCFPNTKVKIGGYTDNTGSEASNIRISQKRADEVRNALIAKKIDPNRMAAEGYGPQYPVTTNDTPEGRAMNRRISIRLTEK